MSLIPAFEIGLWNAWIFMLYHLSLCIILLGSKGLLMKSSAAAPHKNTGKKIVTLLALIYYLALIYSVFLPLKLGTMWFYIGLSVALLGLIIFLLFSFVYEISLLSFASSEERFCIEKYSDAYREYMNRTLRWIGIPKFKKK